MTEHPALDEILREYVDDGGSLEVWEEAKAELRALESLAVRSDPEPPSHVCEFGYDTFE